MKKKLLSLTLLAAFVFGGNALAFGAYQTDSTAAKKQTTTDKNKNAAKDTKTQKNTTKKTKEKKSAKKDKTKKKRKKFLGIF